MMLAKTTNTPVLYTVADIPVEVAEPIKSADAPIVMQLRQAPIMAIKPTGEEVQLAEVVTPPPALTETQVAAETPAVVEKTLPATASEMPLIALFGLLALGGGFAIRAVAKRLQ